jgi:hypothetical protein
MKKAMIFLLFLMVLVSSALPVFAAGESPPTLSLIFDISTIAGVAALTLIIAGYAKTWLKIEGKWARWVSWIVSIIISLICWALNIGLYEPLSLPVTLVYGLGVGLVANGIFTAELVQSWLQKIGAQPKTIPKPSARAVK